MIRGLVELTAGVGYFVIFAALVILAWNHYPHDTRDTLIAALAVCSITTIVLHAFKKRPL